MIICFVFCIISTIITLAFNEPIANSKQKKQSTGFIAYYKDMLITFKQIIKSNRLK